MCIDIYLAQLSIKEGQIGGKEDGVSSIVFQMRATVFFALKIGFRYLAFV